MIEKIKTYIKDVVILSKQKEDETTWSKIDSLFNKVNEVLETVEGAKYFLQYSLDLLIRSILSDRSKLNGSSLVLTRNIINICKDETPSLGLILSTVLKVCGRSNKVVYTRGQDAFVYICSNVNILPFAKLFSEYSTSTNKNIRLTVFKGIFSKSDTKYFEKLILKGKNDPSIEVRSICKQAVVVDVVSKVTNVEPKRSYIPFSSRSAVQKNVETEKVKEVIKEKDEVSHSPLKKSYKFERKKENKDCDKIEELENQVKSITNECKDTKGRSKIQSLINSYNSKAFLQSLSKKEVEPVKKLDEDLTPKKLDKFLSKYRVVYGNLGEKKENVKKETVLLKESPKKEIDQISLMDNSLCLEPMDVLDVKPNKKKSVLHEEKCLSETKEEDDITKDFSNLSLVEEKAEDVFSESSSPVNATLNFEYTIVNSDNPTPECDGEITYNKNTQVDAEEICLVTGNIETQENSKHEDANNNEISELEKKTLINFYHSQDEITKEKEDVINFNNIETSDKSSSTEEHVQIHKATSDGNRFSSLLYSDKDECVIFDINKESPGFNSIRKDDTSPLSKAVVQTEISSSFLYSKEQEKNKCLENRTPDNFTMIDSTTCVDKNTFKREE